MCDKAIQVSIGCKRIRKVSISCQVGTEVEKKECGIQCGSEARGSYNRDKEHKKWRFEDLLKLLHDKKTLIDWLMDEELIAKTQVCQCCGSEMKLIGCNDRSDGYKWECRRQINNKRHKVEKSIRAGSWFEKCNMTLEEILKFTYWWCQDLDQAQIKHELGISSNTAVDWDMFCRETCEVTLENQSEKLGGEGKVVQIDESKFGKRKYHRGHRVEGQWVFGGIEDGTRKSFMVAVDKRDEETLLPVIKKWIQPGTLIISDCWKAYINLEKHGYKHSTVNHSKEFVNEVGEHTNRIEGHWRQAKAKLPSFGVKKCLFSSHLAEFMWRYMHKGEDLFSCFLNDAKMLYRCK